MLFSRTRIGNLRQPSFLARAAPRARCRACYTTQGPKSGNEIFHSRTLADVSDGPVAYNWIDGVERLERYEPGGYHHVMIDDVLDGRYRIVDKLGFGGYSTIWLARDSQLARYVAIKVGISDSSLSRRESDILRSLSASETTTSHVARAVNASYFLPTILDEFSVQGANGTHTCYTVDPAQGNLREASFNRIFPIHAARALAAKLALAVSFVHSRGHVHGDIHLRNVLVKLSSSFHELSVSQFRKKYGEPETVPISRIDGQTLPPNIPPRAVEHLYLGMHARDFTLTDARDLILSDFGEAFAPATEQRLGRDCHTPLSKRAPETLFEPDTPVSFPSDIWSLANAIWEILGMKALFSDSEPADEIVAEQIDVLGLEHLPQSWRHSWDQTGSENSDADDATPRRPTEEREMWPSLDDAFEEFVQKYRRKREATGTFGDDETRAILSLMRGMLRFRPEGRFTMEDVLASEWMVRWALSELRSSDEGTPGS